METHNSEKKSYFLATTAIEEFWDISKPMVFLGSWCQRYSRRSSYSALNAELMPALWNTQEEVKDANVYVKNIYESLLPHLTVALNKIHGTKYSERFWEILLGPWLRLYTPALYDRYCNLRKALTKYNDLTTIGLSEESFVIPSDTLEFVQYLKEDSYNLQLYTKIMHELGGVLERKTMAFISTPFVGDLKANCLRQIIRKKAQNIFRIIYKFITPQRCIFLFSSYFSKNMLISICFRTRGKVMPLLAATGVLQIPKHDMGLRGQLKDLLPEGVEFLNLLKRTLPYDIPRCFLEGFHVLQNKHQLYPANPFALFSSIGWYYDEVFKFWAAVSAENGSILLGTQHGGNYGCVALIPSEEHEIAISDRYYTWGWESDDQSKKVVPLFSSKLSGRRSLTADNRKRGILYVTNSVPRYLFEFAFVPKWFEESIEWQMRFLQNISPDLRQELKVRFHREDHGWDIADRWYDKYPEISIETWKTPFMDSLENSRLIICDFFSTTCVEALSVNKPSILFSNPQVNRLRPEAQPYFDRLRSAGILHDSPDSAAHAAKAAYEDIERWWNKQAIQDARRIFCERFARTSLDPIREWSAEFSDIANNGIVSAPDSNLLNA